MEIVTPQVLTDLMNNLHRFFKIGIYYPAGHAVADQAAASFIRSLNKIAGKEATHVRFTLSENSLTIQGIEVDISQAAAHYFHNLLYSLSIAGLDIHRDITADELRLFLSRLLFLRTSLQNSRDFKEIKITGLPPTVKAHQLTFLASTSAEGHEGSGDSSQPTIDYLLSSLKQHGLKDEQISVCRQLLDSIPDALQNRQIAESDLPSVTWADVEKLLRSVAQSMDSSGQEGGALQPRHHQNIDVLVAILKSLEGDKKESKSRDAVNLLVTMVKGSQPKPEGGDQEKAKPMRRHDPPGMTLDEFQQALELLKERSLPKNLHGNNRRKSFQS